MTIDDILDNLSEFSSDIDNLVTHLKGLGVGSLDEFKTIARGAGVPIPKAMQDALVDKFVNTDDEDWARAQQLNTEEAYQSYLDNHLEGKYRDQARTAKREVAAPTIISTPKPDTFSVKDSYEDIDIKALSKQIKEIETNKLITNKANAIYEKIASYIQTGKITEDDLMDALREDHNFISSKVAHMLWDNGIVNDFASTGIDPEFITCMKSGLQAQSFAPSGRLEKITKVPCTEVYFWGIPSSGKSCAMGAIMSAANDGKTALSMLKDGDCQGFGYMNRLADLFKSDGQINSLPEGTPETSTYEMGFELENEKHEIFPITCIDLAGELVRCMFKKKANEPLNDQQLEVLETLTNVMVDNRTSNRKLHFFVLEYGANDRLYEGLPQSTYLQGAVTYINDTGIFKKDTDGLFLIVTKVDKAGVTGVELQHKLKEYIEATYQGFYNGLKRICRDNEINNGEVEIIPFTLGDVCFQTYCKFDSKTAANVVKTIIGRTWHTKNTRWTRLRNALKK